MNSAIDFSLFAGQVVKAVATGSLTPQIKFSFGSLHVECFWRLRNREYLLYGKHDPQALFRLADDLSGRTVNLVSHREFPSDLTVEFEEGLCLEVLCSGSETENWQLTRPDGFFLVAGPRGRYTFWEPELVQEEK
ncbi:hypothetical protein EV586_101344 [Tumebacillus sp. BK434]|uniref:DUF6188 family protein n=1 Tax=Tumebacillus sp. BK434 TaxID=2512169 RepID=UPI00104F84C5|nr:DUF6188 family protein [Tumebacillus sp. BK434]TCP59128.1 hypothetical protein EV586_101344 [Tumebacillus sp. BK434]